MTTSPPRLARSTALLATALLLVAAGCGEDAAGSRSTSDGSVADDPGTTTTTQLVSPPPAEVLDAELLWFDADGIDTDVSAPPLGSITSREELETFRTRYVDGDPPLGAGPRKALAEGRVLIGGVVSSGCFSADSAELALVAGDVRLIPIGLPDPEPEIACVRAINSVGLVAIDPADLPAGATVQGSRVEHACGGVQRLGVATGA